MDYREQLLRPLSKRYIDHLVQNILESPSEFPFLFELLFDADPKVVWRAAWACSKVSELSPFIFTSEQSERVLLLSLSTPNGGARRGCLSILYHLPLQASISVDFVNSCFEWMLSPRSPIAVQAYSMKLLYRICEQIPELSQELIAHLENLDPYSYSAGFNSTRKNILKSLNKSKLKLFPEN